MNIDHTIDYNHNGGDDGGFGKEIEKSNEKTSANLASKRIWRLEYQMHLRVWKVVMLD